jgi:hypothetical protein
VRTVSPELIRYLAEQKDPMAAVEELAGRQGDIGQRMDLTASLTIIASALTVTKLAFEIIKLAIEARKSLQPAEVKKEVEAKLPDRTIILVLGDDKVDRLLAQMVGSAS